MLVFFQPEGLLDWPLNPRVLKGESPPHSTRPWILPPGFHFKERLSPANCIRAVKIYADVFCFPPELHSRLLSLGGSEKLMSLDDMPSP